MASSVKRECSDPAIIAWIEGAPGPFEASSMSGVWRKAYADFYGKDIGGFDVGFMLAVEAYGHLLKHTAPRRWILKLN